MSSSALDLIRRAFDLSEADVVGDLPGWVTTKKGATNAGPAADGDARTVGADASKRPGDRRRVQDRAYRTAIAELIITGWAQRPRGCGLSTAN